MNLIETLKNEVSDNVISSLSHKAGVSENQARTGFSVGIPAVLAGILKNGSEASPGFLGNLLSKSDNFGIDNGPEELLNNNNESLLDKGKGMLNDLFGIDATALTNTVASSTGLSADKSTGLIAMIIPLVTGYISKTMTNNGWNVSDLLGKIFENKSDIMAALPQGLTSSLGLVGTLPPEVNIPKVETPRVELPQVEHPTVDPVTYDPVPPSRSGGSFLRWFIPLLIVGALIWWLMGRSGCNESAINNMSDSLSLNIDSASNSIERGAATAATAVTGKLNEAGDFVRDLGDRMSKNLPNGNEINIADNSVENQLILFIEDENRTVDKTTWFTFDRLYFETGKSTLKTESQEQLNNIAEILKAYPNVNLKIGGYTDNTGDAAVNTKISTDRANAAMQELIKLGIDANRLEAEGYGSEHPVASNETAEGRAQNRRIDVRVTQK